MIYLALRAIAAHARQTGRPVTHFRGDGSSTSYKEMQLWGASGVDLSESGPWRKHLPLAPYNALVEADQQGVYIITDRATFLTVRRDGAARSICVYVQRGSQLLNLCSALVNLKTSDDERWPLAREFAQWLGEGEAQAIVTNYGRRWPTGVPLFAPKHENEMDPLGWDFTKANL